MNRTGIAALLLAVLLVAGTALPAMALSTSAAQSAGTGSASDAATTAAQAAAPQNNSSVNVTVGQQLSTVIDVSSDEVQTDFENTAFEFSFERGEEDERVEAIAERTEELRERAEDIREDYDDATEAYREGELTASEYAQELATLNARASNLLESVERLQNRRANVSAFELRAAGVNQSALQDVVENLRSVNGSGTAALLQQFTGEARGEIELETADGFSIEIENEDGEQSREFEAPRDNNNSITVSQANALDTAREALGSPETGNWTLQKASIHEDSGYHKFEFVLTGSNKTGEAEVRVDGSTGDVFRLESEIEVPERDDDDEDGDDDEREDGELALLVSDGAAAPGATITITALADGAPADGVMVHMNDREIGTTDENGTVTVTLPEQGEVEFEAERGDASGELEFEFGDGSEEDDEVFQRLATTATLDNDTVTVSVNYDGTGVANASVFANDRAVGTTDAEGTVTFTLDSETTEELELEVVKGAFEAELRYDIQDGSLVLTEEAHEGDGDKAESDEEEEAEEVEDSDADDGAEESEDDEAEEEDDEHETETESEPEEEDDEPDHDESEDDGTV
ncbi:hypothetical protein [Haloarchaeobius sp. HME9146]|uniref:DUF7096 domain-containing protein n=1 Tax=Haloarchaeobius sp. HME9146 TaxID=2978732 RepID=UPI0021C137EC|nr:hypothetical protein [Haloarchaeobius sp. HME9146]MCT9098136.1 hypothetical protein [Haloarchaeobius sp. HME9146]